MGILKILHPKNTYRYVLTSTLALKEISAAIRLRTDTKRTFRALNFFFITDPYVFKGGINDLTGIITLEKEVGTGKNRSIINIDGKIKDKKEYREIELEITFSFEKYFILFFVLGTTIIVPIVFGLRLMPIAGLTILAYCLYAAMIYYRQKKIIDLIISWTKSTIKTDHTE